MLNVRWGLLQSELDSFLIEITALILAKKDEDGAPLADKILDKTGMKGTGAGPLDLPTSQSCSSHK